MEEFTYNVIPCVWNCRQVEKFFAEADAIYEKSHDPKVFGDLNESLEIANAFRHNVSLKGNDKLDDIRMKLSIKGSHSADLIGTYLSDILELKKGLSKAYEENLGEVTFLGGLEDSKLYVHLKGVRNLRPRPNREGKKCIFFYLRTEVKLHVMS